MLSLVTLFCCYWLFIHLSETTQTNNEEEHSLVSWDSAIEMDDSNMSDSQDSRGDNLEQNNLIVNYLPETTTQSDLHKMFEGFGDIESCRLIRHKVLGHSLGYGFVKYKNHEDAESAICALNGLEMSGKKLKVSFARPSTDPIKTANLYICGLKNTITEAELIAIFAPFGKVLTVKVMNADNDPSKTTAIGFVRFEQHSDAQNAVESLNGKTPSESQKAPIHVSFAKQSKDAQLPIMPPSAYSHVPGSNFAPPRFGKAPPLVGKNIRYDPMGRVAPGRGGIMHGGYPMHDNFAVPDPNPGAGYVLFVFNLAPEVEELHLWRLFGPFGAIRSVSIIMDKVSNRSKGFAFITMFNYEEAETAIRHLNQTTLEGRVIQVSFKSPKK